MSNGRIRLGTANADTEAFSVPDIGSHLKFSKDHFILAVDSMSAIPPLQKLVFALAVARELHFTNAAARLHISQPYLSRKIREYECELGFPLFRRNHRVVELTKAGSNFLKYARDMLADLNSDYGRAVDIGRAVSRQQASSFVIGYSPFIPSRLRCQVRAIQRVRFPALHLELRPASALDASESIASGAFQAALTLTPLDRSDLAYIPVHRERLHVVLPRGQSMSSPGEISLADLRGRPLILPCSERTHPGLRRWFLEQCTKAGFTANVVEDVSSTEGVFDRVQDGVGLAILPASACEGMSAELETAPIADLEPAHLVLAWRRNRSARTEKVVTEIARSLRNFERRRKIFSRPNGSAKRRVVPIDSKRSRIHNRKASSNA